MENLKLMKLNEQLENNLIECLDLLAEKTGIVVQEVMCTDGAAIGYAVFHPEDGFLMNYGYDFDKLTRAVLSRYIKVNLNAKP